MDILVGQLQFEFENEFLDHPGDHFRRQIGEGNDRIQTVAEFRGEHFLHRFVARIFLGHIAETNAFSRHVGRAGVGRHDQHDIAEIDRLAVMICQLAVIHHLQQNVEQVGF